MMAARTIDPEQNWFFQQGLHDGREGLLAIAPDEVRCQCQRSDYYTGYAAGAEDRAAGGEAEIEDALDAESLERSLLFSPEEAADVVRQVNADYDAVADSIGSWRDAIAELKRTHNPNEDSR